MGNVEDLAGVGIVLRVDDVGRAPGDSPTTGSDGDLEYFRSWRNQSRLAGLPVVYGVVPAWLSAKGLQYLEGLSAAEELAVHGWNHLRSNCDEELMRRGKLQLESVHKCRSYIAPYNLYNHRTLRSWALAGGRWFFGGFDGTHHSYGPLPVRAQGVVHLPVSRELYGRSEEIALVSNWPSFAVVAVHVPWEPGIPRLVECLRRHLIPLDEVPVC